MRPVAMCPIDLPVEMPRMGMSRPLLKLGGGSGEILRDVRH